MTVHERICTGWFARRMRASSWRGITLPVPFGGMLVLYWGVPTEDQALHELAHCEQAQRMGKWRWAATILGEYIWHRSFRDTPLEREARQMAGQE